MIDLHCHILPGVDDGAQTNEQALAMAKMAVKSGVKTIVATPHTNIAHTFENYASPELNARFDAFRQLLHEENIPLTIVKGAEIYCDGDVVSMLQRGIIPTINHTKYPLVEFSFKDEVSHVVDSLQHLLDAGYIPIIAHPERYTFVQHDPQGLLPFFADMGCILQINKGSPLGHFGTRAHRVSNWMLEQGLVHIVASDGHRDTQRTPYLADVYDFLQDYYGQGCPELLLQINPMRVLQNEPVESVFE